MNRLIIKELTIEKSIAMNAIILRIEFFNPAKPKRVCGACASIQIYAQDVRAESAQALRVMADEIERLKP